MRTTSGFDEESVLALVNVLHERNPAQKTFTLTEIAEALQGPGSTRIAQGSVVTNTPGEIIAPPIMPAWMEALNNILKKLGQEGRLQIITTAVAVFPPGQA
jgi:hypothetical protein